ncbi:hypothetical protein FOXG_07120 [Fusarium oxysporum f. sp. lycopersici 4287]|uniref:NAD(P)-binding protein n=1 Tax=Fusarium oxysporum f. sp. lycopersici (strain 4287 / CBS 123668 / FGSC 9935 / NRRL 34936) TaxID=426428 RepID=A0A0J9V4E7_FUSO4|nr:hypothetical protein FOXG_07120 [Fusarium oxysporum f. sp. lycopersici 4287]KAJ9419516.1 hypothetical protein QL093DRAFT_2016308 [Fusarium oxysporum]KNB06399.1 hypothetical protein FOXG_07120 [Fusarium oxysporum f. sp. lycopersici 4287]
MADLLREIRAKWSPEPLPPRDTFDGQTVLVTGGTGGLGLATAKHFATLGAAKVIITYRNKPRAETARQQIETAARAAGRERVVIETMELDLTCYSSCISFVEKLVRRTTSIDVVILNAGTFNSEFIMSPDGWEETIQANTLSTALLAILLLKWMKAGRQNRQTPANLVFVSSGRHLTPDISEWPEWEKRDGGILLHYKDASNWPSTGVPDAMYATSKLLLMYVFEEICKLAVDAKGEPQVIVKSVCPGICNTDLSRALKKRSLVARMAIPVVMSIIGKSPEIGARYIIAAALAPPEKHGKFIRFYLTDEEFRM